MSAVTDVAWRRVPRKQRTLGRLRTYLNHLNRKHPLAYIAVLSLTLDAVLFTALSLSEMFK